MIVLRNFAVVYTNTTILLQNVMTKDYEHEMERLYPILVAGSPLLAHLEAWKQEWNKELTSQENDPWY